MTPNSPEQVTPPALPQATEQYDRRFQDQSNNVLRLFFNRLSGAINSIVSPDLGGAKMFTPHGEFLNTTSQTAITANTINEIEFPSASEVPTLGVAVSGGANSEVSVLRVGVYVVHMHLQIYSTAASGGSITVWAGKNNTAIPNSAQITTLEGLGAMQMIYTLHVTLDPDDTLKLYWMTDDVDVSLEAYSAGVSAPAVPSTRLNVSFVSNLLT